MRNKAPCPPAILIAMAVCRCDTKRIVQCSMEATRRRHLATTYYVTRATINKTTMQNTPTVQAILMAIMMRR